MSHFFLIVTGEDVDKQLEPFSENLEVPVYVRNTKEELIANVRKNIAWYTENTYKEYLSDPEKYKVGCRTEGHFEYVSKEFPKRLSWSDEECYADAIDGLEPENIDSNGGELSTYNPNTQWDWYQEGGRYDSRLLTYDGRETNIATVGELDLDKFTSSFAVLHDGVWDQKGSMGWWGIVSDEVAQDEWNAKFREILSDLPPDTKLTVVDCHI